MQRTAEVEFECPFSTEDCEGITIEITCTDPGEPASWDYPGSGPTFEYEVPSCCKCGHRFESATLVALEDSCEAKKRKWDFSPDEPDTDRAYDRWVDERDNRDSNFGAW